MREKVSAPRGATCQWKKAALVSQQLQLWAGGCPAVWAPPAHLTPEMAVIPVTKKMAVNTALSNVEVGILTHLTYEDTISAEPLAQGHLAG